MSIKEFGRVSEKLSQNPLGIIALFIVLVYGFASLVVGLGQNLGGSQAAPLIWFMVLFPPLVLGVFGWLVSSHHTKLYAPRDFQEGSHFLAVSGFNPPAAIRETAEPLVVTAEGTEGSATSESLEAALLRKDYPDNVREGIYLIHEAEILRERTTPASGRYRVRIWLESYSRETIHRVRTVTYRLWDDFPTKVISTSAPGRQFETWLNVYGEFNVVAYVEFDDGSGIWLTRYLNLPGRPVD